MEHDREEVPSSSLPIEKPTVEEYIAIARRYSQVQDGFALSNDAALLALETRVRSYVNTPSCGPSQAENGRTGGSREPRYILALDIAYQSDTSSSHDDSEGQEASLAVASGVLYDTRTKEVLIQRSAIGKATFPYVPSFLAFREVPLLAPIVADVLQAWRDIDAKDDEGRDHNALVLLCDGHGVAHPRLCGLACHLGVLFDLPSIGVAKSHFVGRPSGRSDAVDGGTKYDAPMSTKRKEMLSQLAAQRGARLWLDIAEGDFTHERAGVVLRTQDIVRPLYLSPGHGLSTAVAAQITLELCSAGYRQPEPMRLADQLGRQVLREQTR